MNRIRAPPQLKLFNRSNEVTHIPVVTRGVTRERWVTMNVFAIGDVYHSVFFHALKKPATRKSFYEPERSKDRYQLVKTDGPQLSGHTWMNAPQAPYHWSFFHNRRHAIMTGGSGSAPENFVVRLPIDQYHTGNWNVRHGVEFRGEI